MGLLAKIIVGAGGTFALSSAAATPTLTAIAVIDGSVNSLPGIRQLNDGSGVSANQYWHAAGYFSLADGGGGDFYTGPSLTSCGTTSITDATWSQNSPVIGFSTNAGVHVGMALAETIANQLTKYDMVVAVGPTSLTLATAPVGTMSGVSLSFSPDNGGSVVADQETSPHCFYRVSYNYSPKEWGAYENFNPANLPLSNDDTIPLGNWINANQPHIAVPGLSGITAPLICNDGGIIQGPPTQGVAESNTSIPQFTIYAPNPPPPATFAFSIVPGSGIVPPMLQMQPQNLSDVGPARCAIHGVGLIADGAGAIDTVHALGSGDLIDGHSYLAQGRYNVSDAATTSNLQIYDSSINSSYSHGVYLTSSSAKISRNSIAGAGSKNPAPGDVGDDIYIAPAGVAPSGISSDILISENIIQQAQGWGLNANNTRFLRAISNYFDDNGKQVTSGGTATLAGIQIANSSLVSICGNTFHRSAAGSQGTSTPTSPPASYTYHVHFTGADDSVSLCGNVYLPGVTNGSTGLAPPIQIRPDFNYDADPAAVLTNFSIQDNPASQNYGVYSPGSTTPNAVTLLQSSNIALVPQNFFSGLTLSNVAGSSSQVKIARGAAADSTNSAILTLSSPCTVDLSATTPGLGAVDIAPVQPHTTYYFFVVAAPGGGSANCIASQSQTPSFQNAGAYALTPKTYTIAGSQLVFNAGNSSATPAMPTVSSNLAKNPLAGLAVGDAVTGGGFGSSFSSITSLSPYYQSWNGTTNGGSPLVTFSVSVMPPLSGVVPYMVVNGPQILIGSFVTVVCPTSSTCLYASPSLSACSPVPCVTLNQTVNGTGMNTGPVTFGGNFNFAASPAASSTTYPDAVMALGGLYRLVGALYTQTGTDVVPFVQDGQTFYLQTSVMDINTNTPTCANSFDTHATPCALSVPCGLNATCAQGVKVEAFGRIVGGPSKLLLSSYDQTGITHPVGFMSGEPGYATTSTMAHTAYPFRVYTNTAGQVRLQANAGGTGAFEVTEGWVFHPTP